MTIQFAETTWLCFACSISFSLIMVHLVIQTLVSLSGAERLTVRALERTLTRFVSRISNVNTDVTDKHSKPSYLRGTEIH